MPLLVTIPTFNLREISLHSGSIFDIYVTRTYRSVVSSTPFRAHIGSVSIVTLLIGMIPISASIDTSRIGTAFVKRYTLLGILRISSIILRRHVSRTLAAASFLREILGGLLIGRTGSVLCITSLTSIFRVGIIRGWSRYSHHGPFLIPRLIESYDIGIRLNKPW